MAESSISTDINAHSTNNERGGAYNLTDRFRSFFTRCRQSQDSTLAPYQELIISQKVFHRSVNCLRFAVFVDAIAGTVEQPNYRESLLLMLNLKCSNHHSTKTASDTAIMVLPPDSPGAHPDSFPTTEPFGFSAATYFVPMCALLGGNSMCHRTLFLHYDLANSRHIYSGYLKPCHWEIVRYQRSQAMHSSLSLRYNTWLHIEVFNTQKLLGIQCNELSQWIALRFCTSCPGLCW
jgi:hypothetical protein